jgi:hypothetical protein
MRAADHHESQMRLGHESLLSGMLGMMRYALATTTIPATAASATNR